MVTSQPLKICFLPFFAQGHQLPLIHLSRLVASRGQHVTIITTPCNAKLFENSIDEDAASRGHHIRLHIIDFPSDKVGLRAGVENVFDANDNDTARKIHMAAHFIRPQVESFMQQSPQEVFIADIVYTWSEALSKSLGIPRLVFNPLSIFDVCIIEAIKAHPEAFESDSAPYNIPGLPHPLTLPIKPSPGFCSVMESMVQAENGSHGVIANSFKELDVEYTEHYEKLTGRKVFYYGPSSLMLQKTLPRCSAGGGNEEHECLRWLSSKVKGSVVYISFGSAFRLTDEQLREMALGLEKSGHKFMWVVHGIKSAEGGKWLLHDFEERMKREERGMIVKEWVPQPLILNHAAVGAFLSQCGWNAVTEAATAGLPMITMPGYGDQYYLEKLVTVVHGYGVEVGGAEWSLSPYDAKKEVVSAERIERAVRKVMDGGDEEGKRIREKAKEMKKKAWKAVEEGGSSYNSLTELIDYLHTLVPNSNPVAAIAS